MRTAIKMVATKHNSGRKHGGSVIAFVLVVLVASVAAVGVSLDTMNHGAMGNSNSPAQAAPIQNQTSTTEVTANVLNASITFVKSGVEPDSAALDASNQFLYVTNFGSGNITEINLVNDTVIGTLRVGSTPDSIAYDPMTKELYVSNFYGKDIEIISPSANSTLETLAFQATPSSIIFNPLNGVVYGVERSGTIVTLGPSGATPLAIVNSSFQISAAIFDQSNHEFYIASSNSVEGRIDVLQQNGSPITHMTVEAGPVALAVDQANGRIFVANQENNTVSVVDTSSNKVIATIPVDGSPSGICYDPIDGYIFETNQGSGTILAINGTNDTVVGELILPPNSQPHSITCNLKSNTLYVTDWGTGDVAVISIS